MTTRLLTREELRLCVDAVKTVARERGVEKDAAAVARIMATVADLFNKGMRTHDDLVAAMKAETTI
ncbi:hypothetical protein [Rhizobium grahamii]|uniref:Uncharacterized protein n=1 Tax=Rhizobium grahamii CCGE 502 TaxID=990285 RepID=S3HG75_9HYPH|nr:hypothetical protein [Rhizobium grahamii]EPE97060.1 hypothetical protein RGCCGE502_16890 [Rhizobium grahamii CCGE 502]